MFEICFIYNIYKIHVIYIKHIYIKYIKRVHPKSSHHKPKFFYFFNVLSIRDDECSPNCDIHFMTYVSQITVLYTLNSAVCPLCVNKTGRKKPQKRFKKKWTSFCILLYKRQFSTSSALASLPILQTDKWKSDVVRWFDQALSLHLTTGPCLELPSTGPRSPSPSVNHSAWQSGERQLHTDDATRQHSSGSFPPLSLTRPLLVCFLAPFNWQRPVTFLLQKASLPSSPLLFHWPTPRSRSCWAGISNHRMLSAPSSSTGRCVFRRLPVCLRFFGK